MLIITALNITGGNGTRDDGTADYEVCAGVNDLCFWKGNVNGHIRNAGAAVLLRKIADKMDGGETGRPSQTSFGRLAGGKKKL